LYEAAAVDGAGAWARFRAVTWPGISSAVYLAAVLQALWAFREFEVIYPMTAGGPAGSTQTLAIYLYNEAFQFFHLGYASALGVVTIGICVIFVAIAYPRMRRNLSRS
jgi:multiple sugar transport system permease protein